jgi:hypothetical protein
MIDRVELLSSIADTIMDYRVNELSQRTPEHVDRWVSQFDGGGSFRCSPSRRTCSSRPISHGQLSIAEAPVRRLTFHAVPVPLSVARPGEGLT